MWPTRVTRVSVLGAALVTVAACGTSTASTPAAIPTPSAGIATAGPAASPAATAASTSPPSPAATAVPRPAGALGWPTGFAVEMADGTYVTAPPFVIPMTVTISEPGWHAGHLNPVFIDLQRYDGVEVGGLPTLLLGFGWPENVRGADGAVRVAGLTPEIAIDRIIERSSIEARERTEVELFGLRGERIDLHSDLTNNPIFGTADGDFGIQPELDARLSVLPRDDGLLMVAVLAPAPDLEAAWQRALLILETVEIVG